MVLRGQAVAIQGLEGAPSRLPFQSWSWLQRTQRVGGDDSELELSA